VCGYSKSKKPLSEVAFVQENATLHNSESERELWNRSRRYSRWLLGAISLLGLRFERLISEERMASTSKVLDRLPHWSPGKTAEQVLAGTFPNASPWCFRSLHRLYVAHSAVGS
jgi:hypothetical protein